MNRFSRYVITALAVIFISLVTGAVTPSEQTRTTPFPYPTAPDSMVSLNDRTSYVMRHFWDKTNPRKLMSDSAKWAQTFRDYVEFIPHTPADSVRKAVAHLIALLDDDPRALQILASSAERELYGPTAQFWSEEPYLMFTRPVLRNKKVKDSVKQYYLDQIKMLNASQVGANVAPLTYITRDGATHKLYDVKGEAILLLFQPLDCFDCAMMRLRLEADAATYELVKAGKLKIVIINPEVDSPQWRDQMNQYPEEWEIGSNPAAPGLIDLRIMPANYLLDGDFRIVARNMPTDQILQVTGNLYRSMIMDDGDNNADESSSVESIEEVTPQGDSSVSPE